MKRISRSLVYFAGGASMKRRLGQGKFLGALFCVTERDCP